MDPLGLEGVWLFIDEKIIKAVAEAEEGDAEHDEGNAVVDVAERAHAEVVAYLVDHPGDEEPPAYGSRDEAGEADDIEPPVLGRSSKEEVGACEKRDEEKDDERIAHRDAEARKEVLQDTRGLQAGRQAIGRSVLVLQRRGGIGFPKIDGIGGDGQRTHKLECRFILVEPIDHQAQEEDGDDSVEEVGKRGAQSGEESGQSALVERTLDDENTCRTHRGRHQDTNHGAPHDGEYGYLEHQKRGV